MKRLIAVLAFFGVIFLGVFLWWQNGTSPVNKSDKSQKMFVVPPGSGIKAIADDLQREGLIRDDVVFFLLVKQLGLDEKIQAGDFRLSPSMSAEIIAKNLTTGSVDVWVTIKEGIRAEEVAEVLQKTLPNYDEPWVTELIANEGYLFPDTYLIPRDADINLVISLLRNTFDSRYEEVQNTTNLSKEEIVILASMIEREAKEPDRLLVSGVMHNRLQINMPLQIDATVQYALGYSNEERRWWKKGLTYDDLEFSSPYNTYENSGLPPAPIASPGIEALKAAGNPQDSDYLFYITDKTGTNRYARTNEEHNANIKRYGL